MRKSTIQGTGIYWWKNTSGKHESDLYLWEMDLSKWQKTGSMNRLTSQVEALLRDLYIYIFPSWWLVLASVGHR